MQPPQPGATHKCVIDNRFYGPIFLAPLLRTLANPYTTVEMPMVLSLRIRRYNDSPGRRDGRVVEGGGLENR